MLQYICDLYLILIYGHDDSLKSLNEMQQKVSMRLTIIQHDITVIYVTFVNCKFLKPNYIGHKMKCVSFSAHKALPCNSQIYYVTLK